MRFLVSCHLEYSVGFPSTLIFSFLPQRNASQTIVEESLVFTPKVKTEEFAPDSRDNRFLRVETGKRKKFTLDYSATVDCEHQVVATGAIDDVTVAEMDRTAIPYLFPSRYCQSDRLGRLAWDLFGKLPTPYEKVVAIVDWIHANVEYLPGSTTSETSAYDTVTQRTGVCRDFAHLGIALCRALNIPARYFSGYAYELQPPDFHACFEAYIGGNWMIFDATRLAHLNGLVRIGTGRDAAEAAVASIFGRIQCLQMRVNCQLAPGQKFAPLGRKQLPRKGVSLVGDK
ncbi:MAG TPA: transglutaminase family protein [Pirellulaceae bacterium]|nr:transglutaminase family protein [Pirellulaceae bacterium]